MNPTIVTTADGSHSLYIAELSEHYHSVHGAIQESEHVFIRAGLEAVSSHIRHLHLLEMGFGTGLNAFLTYLACRHSPALHVYYTALEAYPIDAQTALKLNYTNRLNAHTHAPVFEAMHQCAWNMPVAVTPNFTLTKLCTTIQEAILPTNGFHLIYFDAFAPSAQPELWTATVFEKMYQALLPQGLLTTYCAKGEVKRTLRKVGFTVQSLPGPIGKREMTRAMKPA